jgi:hypothetical protein
MILGHIPFPVTELWFEARLNGPLKLPPFPGGQLRGVFGASLRALSCMTGFRTCTGCPLRATCPYPALFEPPGRDLADVGLSRLHEGIPPPFVLLLPQHDVGEDGRLQFGMRLFGTAPERLAYIIEAWRRALGRGLGPERLPGRLLLVRGPDGTPVWMGEEITPPAHVAAALPLSGSAPLLVTRTPLRLQASGRPLPADDLTPRRLVAGIIRRARMLAVHAGTGADVVKTWPVQAWLEDADKIVHAPALQWQDWHRYSARQRRRMNLGGFVGQWQLEQVPESVQPLLVLGTLLHVGKDTSFGLGAYAVTAR